MKIDQVMKRCLSTKNICKWNIVTRRSRCDFVFTSRIFFWLKESSTCKASDPRSLASSRMKAPNCIRGCGRDRRKWCDVIEVEREVKINHSSLNWCSSSFLPHLFLFLFLILTFVDAFRAGSASQKSFMRPMRSDGKTPSGVQIDCKNFSITIFFSSYTDAK